MEDTKTSKKKKTTQGLGKKFKEEIETESETDGGEDWKAQFSKVDSKVMDLFQATIEEIKGTITFFHCENMTLRQQNEKMVSDMNNETNLKKEFTSEFEQVKKKISMAQKWEEEATEIKRRNDWLSNQLHKFNQRHNKMCLQAFNQLSNIKNKFSGNERIQEQVNFSRFDQVKHEIESDLGQERKNNDSFQEEFSFLDDLTGKVRDAQIMELIAICCEISNVLNFDLKHLDLKDQQINDLKNGIKDLEQLKNEEINVFKSNISTEIDEVKRAYHGQIVKLDAMNQDLKKDLDTLSFNNEALQNELANARRENESTKLEYQKVSSMNQNFRDTIKGLEVQLNKSLYKTEQETIKIDMQLRSLTFQKKIMTNQIQNLSQNY